MWTIYRIDEADYGCEERLPGQPFMALVTLENDLGELLQFEMPEDWLTMQGLDEGDEWPEDIDADDTDSIKAQSQDEWMANYNRALQEFEDATDN